MEQGVGPWRKIRPHGWKLGFRNGLPDRDHLKLPAHRHHGEHSGWFSHGAVHETCSWTTHFMDGDGSMGWQGMRPPLAQAALFTTFTEATDQTHWHNGLHSRDIQNEAYSWNGALLMEKLSRDADEDATNSASRNGRSKNTLQSKWLQAD